MALNEKQARFVDEYLIDLNATQAAIRAGYSAKRASEIGYQLLQKTTVQESIAKAMAERSKRTGINQDRVITELAKIALLNPDDLINHNNASVRPDASKDDLACIQSVKVKISDSEKGHMIVRGFVQKLVSCGQPGRAAADNNDFFHLSVSIFVSFPLGSVSEEECSTPSAGDPSPQKWNIPGSPPPRGPGSRRCPAPRQSSSL